VWAALWLVLMVGVFYLLIWRPQQRRMAAVRELQHSLSLGDDVITTGGIYGTITALRDDHVELEIAPNIVVRVARGAIGAQVVTHDDAPGTDVDEPNGPEGTA
jgi:preprotein translocase subunit YajC